MENVKYLSIAEFAEAAKVSKNEFGLDQMTLWDELDSKGLV